MVEWIIAIVVIALGVVLIPWLCSGLGRGMPPSGGGGEGNLLLELDRIVNPGGRHAVEARQTVTRLPGKADPPDDGDDDEVQGGEVERWAPP